jgi:hypothetical protein
VRTPPDDEFDASKAHGRYSDADWLTIEKSLAGIDLDATPASKYPYLAPDHLEQGTAPLREALQNLAGYYAAKARLKPVTRSERIDLLKQDEAALEAARKATVYPMVKTALAVEVDRVRRERAKLMNAESARGENAKRLHRKFWDELLRLWRDLPIEQRTHENLRSFLYACSAPIFPENTMPTALTAFTEDHYKARRSGKRAR